MTLQYAEQPVDGSVLCDHIRHSMPDGTVALSHTPVLTLCSETSHSVRDDAGHVSVLQCFLPKAMTEGAGDIVEHDLHGYVLSDARQLFDGQGT